MPKKYKFFSILFTVFVLGIFICSLGVAKNQFSLSQKEFEPLLDVMAIIQEQYVEEADEKKLITGAISGTLRSLDPYSQYLDKQAYTELKAETEGKFCGIGAEISIKGGHLHIIAPLSESPAERSGLLPQDQILKIDSEFTKDMSVSDAARRLRGEPGTNVKLSILRKNEVKEFSIQREWVTTKSIKEARFLEDGIGYIKLTAFQERSPSDFEQALKDLEARNLKALIIDLRNNSGGFLSAGVEIAEKFIPSGRLIVATKGREERNKVEHLSKNSKPRNIPFLFVLINKGSASSSEILAGALQDYKLATLIGTQSYGKGSIQTLIPLGKDTAIRLTTSRYYTPKGRLIHEIGITPDVVVEENPELKDQDVILSKAQSLARENLSKK